MPFELTFSTIIGVGVSLISALSQIELWQRKEYRVDRFFSHVNNVLKHPKHLLFLWLALVALALGWLAYLFNYSAAVTIAGAASILAYVIHHSRRLRRQGLMRPKPTLRANLTVIGTLLIALLYVNVALVPVAMLWLQWATLVFFIPAFAALATVIVGLPFMWRKQQIIAQATAARRVSHDVTVIGITGSFGKTSTKHFLKQILEHAGSHVETTQEHHNTPIGLAYDIRDQLGSSKPTTFIAELGAYRAGEIQELAEIAQPQIGIITGIGNQHIDLFGSQQAIVNTKWELIDELPKDGIAVLNQDDAFLPRKAAHQKLSQRVIWFSARTAADVYATNIQIAPTKLTCEIHIGKTKQAVSIPLASPGLLSNVLAAAAAAYAASFPPEKIFAALALLKPYSRTMEILTGKHGATIIDDSYSANEQGVLNAIEHLAHFPPADKRIVLLPLIELGEKTEAVHKKIGQAIHASGAKLFVYGSEYQQQLGEGFYTSNAKELAQKATEGLSKNSVVLLENRIPEVVRQAILG